MDICIIYCFFVSGYDILGNCYINLFQFINDEGVFYQQGEVYSKFYDDFDLLV